MTEAATEQAIDLSVWESEFVEGVRSRLITYGSAFRDGAKGALEDPLSTLQGQKLRELLKKTRTPKDQMPKTPMRKANPDGSAVPGDHTPGGDTPSSGRKQDRTRKPFGRAKAAGRRTGGIRASACTGREQESDIPE